MDFTEQERNDILNAIAQRLIYLSHMIFDGKTTNDEKDEYRAESDRLMTIRAKLTTGR